MPHVVLRYPDAQPIPYTGSLVVQPPALRAGYQVKELLRLGERDERGSSRQERGLGHGGLGPARGLFGLGVGLLRVPAAPVLHAAAFGVFVRRGRADLIRGDRALPLIEQKVP